MENDKEWRRAKSLTMEARIENHKSKLEKIQFNFLMECAGENPSITQWRKAVIRTKKKYGLPPKI